MSNALFFGNGKEGIILYTYMCISPQNIYTVHVYLIKHTIHVHVPSKRTIRCTCARYPKHVHLCTMYNVHMYTCTCTCNPSPPPPHTPYLGTEGSWSMACIVLNTDSWYKRGAIFISTAMRNSILMTAWLMCSGLVR